MPALPQQLVELEDCQENWEWVSKYLPFLSTFQIEGANNNWVTYFDAGQLLYADAANTIPIQWKFTPPVKAWVQIDLLVDTRSQTAAWGYNQPRIECSPAPTLGGSTPKYLTLPCHNAFLAISGAVTALFGCSAGVEYTFDGHIAGATGGAANTNQYYQGNNYLSLVGKAWIAK